jgi:hypothetical protein
MCKEYLNEEKAGIFDIGPKDLRMSFQQGLIEVFSQYKFTFFLVGILGK